MESALNPGQSRESNLGEVCTSDASQFSHLHNGDNSIDGSGLFGGLNAIRQFKS